MKLIICGLARHGKDTAAEYLRDKYGMTFQSSSRAALDIFLFDSLNMNRGWSNLKPYPDKDAAFADRVNLREYWHESIKCYNTPDKARLAKEILSKNDIYVGMRCRDELAAIRNEMSVPVLWVDATERLGVTETAASITIGWTDCDTVICNNTTLEEFHSKLDTFYKLHLQDC